MLNVVSLEEAKKTVEAFAAEMPTEEARLSQALGRTLAEDIISAENIPAFDRSTVDGYAIRAADAYGASESMPAQLVIKREIPMGGKADFELFPGECAKISTGGMLPAGADAAVMVENTDCEDGLCLAYSSVSPFENVTRAGDDVKNGETVLKSGAIINPNAIGVLAALGISKVRVKKRPVAGIISTGDEIVDINASPLPGQVRDVNTYMLAALCKAAGCDIASFGVIGDEHDGIFTAVKEAAQTCDVVLLSGGSSAGAKDMTARVIGELGRVLVHGIAVKPGKPTVIGDINGKAVFGLPGHPAAAYFSFISLVKPLLYRMGGRTVREVTEKCRLGSNVPSNNGRTEFVCVRINGEKAEPVYSKSGIISLLSKTDGYIVIDRNSEGLEAGTAVDVHILN